MSILYHYLSSKNAVFMTLQDQEYAIAGFLGMEK